MRIRKKKEGRNKGLRKRKGGKEGGREGGTEGQRDRGKEGGKRKEGSEIRQKCIGKKGNNGSANWLNRVMEGVYNHSSLYA